MGYKVRGSKGPKRKGPKGMGMWKCTCEGPRDVSLALPLISHGTRAKSLGRSVWFLVPGEWMLACANFKQGQQIKSHIRGFPVNLLIGELLMPVD